MVKKRIGGLLILSLILNWYIKSSKLPHADLTSNQKEKTAYVVSKE